MAPGHHRLCRLDRDRGVAAADEVEGLDTIHEITSTNKNAANLSGVSTLQSGPLGLDGTGVRVGVWDGGAAGAGASIYVDGQEVTNSRTDGTGTLLSDAANTFNIGSRGGTDAFFNGLIDDVRIYDRALSAEEIQALYQSGN
mgnify:CR=1 FL=1